MTPTDNTTTTPPCTVPAALPAPIPPAATRAGALAIPYVSQPEDVTDTVIRAAWPHLAMWQNADVEALRLMVCNLVYRITGRFSFGEDYSEQVRHALAVLDAEREEYGIPQTDDGG